VAKFEEGSLPWALIIGFNAALGLLEEAGIANIERHIRGLVEHLAEGLSDLGADVYPPPEARRHIVTFTHPAVDGAKLLETLTSQNFVISRRRGRVRVSPHLYNTQGEIDQLLAAIGEFIAAG
jgi:selenocysteine lyase/cysteine desulfurase